MFQHGHYDLHERPDCVILELFDNACVGEIQGKIYIKKDKSWDIIYIVLVICIWVLSFLHFPCLCIYIVFSLYLYVLNKSRSWDGNSYCLNLIFIGVYICFSPPTRPLPLSRPEEGVLYYCKFIQYTLVTPSKTPTLIPWCAATGRGDQSAQCSSQIQTLASVFVRCECMGIYASEYLVC